MKGEYDWSVQVFQNSFSSSMGEQMKQQQQKSVQEEMAETSSCVQGCWEVDNQWDIDWGSRAGIWGPTVETEFEFMNRIVLCDYLFTAGTAEALLVGLKRMKIIQK